MGDLNYDFIKPTKELNDWEELMHMPEWEVREKDPTGALWLKQQRLVMELHADRKTNQTS